MNSNEHKRFERVEDFLTDADFCLYCLGSDIASVDKWTRWLKDHPEKKPIADEARDLFYLLNGGNTREQFIKDFTEFRSAAEKVVGAGAEREKRTAKILYMRRRAVAIAAALFVMLAVGYLIKLRLGPDEGRMNSLVVDFDKGEDILPGGNRATLTLADGSVVVLDTLQSGSISNQGNANVLKSGDGELLYRVQAAGSESVVMVNKVSTPRGGQYRVLLSDGTAVWLNAASSLKYPVAFNGKERKVELIGEGYFEVAQDAQKPFIVNIGGMDVKVLGTSFNINGYSDEDDLKVTLVEGKVEVDATGQRALLFPGNQARLGFQSQKLDVIKSADVAAATAWKNGYFDLNGLDLQQMLRQISRWYNIDIEYQGIIPKLQFGGKIQKSLPLSSVVDILKMSNVNVYVTKDNIMIIKP